MLLSLLLRVLFRFALTGGGFGLVLSRTMQQGEHRVRLAVGVLACHPRYFAVSMAPRNARAQLLHSGAWPDAMPPKGPCVLRCACGGALLRRS